MPQITIVGKAEREVACDVMELAVTFIAHADSAEEVLQMVLEDSEDCLGLLVSMGIDIKTVRLGENQIRQERNREKAWVEASREIKLELGFDMVLLNSIMEAIRDRNYQVVMRSSFRYSDVAALRRELLAEALADSRKKAEVIAMSMGETLCGIHSAEQKDRYGRAACGGAEAERDLSFSIVREPLRSDKLSAPQICESEEIEVVWVMT